MLNLRRVLKTTAELLLTGAGMAHLGRRRHSGSSLVLAFHNILGPRRSPIGDRPLHLPIEDFEQFLDRLTATHDIIALEGIGTPSPGRRPQAAITFDDAYAGAIQFGLPVLTARGLPATIFVAPGLLGRPACWWDGLAHPVNGLEEATRNHALTALGGEEERILNWAGELGLPKAGLWEDCRIATEEELAVAANCPGITLGAHSWSHPDLSGLSPAKLDQELSRPLPWLRERFPGARPWLAYPYGMTSPLVEAAAKRAGYALAFRVSGGYVTPSEENAWNLPRWSVSAGLSERGFASTPLE